MRRALLVALGLAWGCGGRDGVVAEDLEGVWVLERGGLWFDDCPETWTSRLALTGRGEAQWLLRVDSLAWDDSGTEVCDWGRYAFTHTELWWGQWFVVDRGIEASIAIESEGLTVEEYGYEDQEPLEPTGYTTAETRVLEYGISTGEDEEGPWLFVFGWGLHRPFE